MKQNMFITLSIIDELPVTFTLHNNIFDSIISNPITNYCEKLNIIVVEKIVLCRTIG